MKNIKKISIFIIIVMGIIMSCSDSDVSKRPTNDPTNDPTTQNNAVSGVAVDGYLRKAKVFLDCNQNFILDADEEAVLTDNDGEFTFPSSTGSNKLKTCPVVVDATDTTQVVDTDDMVEGKLVNLKDAKRQGFKMSAPAGQYELISPMTMIVHTLDEEAGKEEIMDSLGLTDDDLQALGVSSLKELLSMNYLSTNDIDPQALEVINNIAKKARVLARVLETKQSPTEAESNLCEKQRCPVLMKEALANFSNVYEKLEDEGKFHGDGRPDVDFNYMYDKMVEIEEDATFKTYDFETVYEGDEKIYATEFLEESILEQVNGKPCISGEASSTYEYVISLTFKEPTFPQDGATSPIDVTWTSALFVTAKDLYTLYNKDNAQAQVSCEDFFTKKVGGAAKRLEAFNNLFESYEKFYTNQDDSSFYLSSAISSVATSFDITNHYISFESYAKTLINLEDYTDIMVFSEFSENNKFLNFININGERQNEQQIKKQYPKITDFTKFSNQMIQIHKDAEPPGGSGRVFPCFDSNGDVINCDTVYIGGIDEFYTPIPTKVKKVKYDIDTMNITITDSGDEKEFAPLESLSKELQDAFSKKIDKSGGSHEPSSGHGG